MKKYRRYVIPVTDLSAQLWCEKQLEFKLKISLKKKKYTHRRLQWLDLFKLDMDGGVEKKEIQAGKKRHKELYEEITTFKTVKPTTLEDHIAGRLYNCKVGLARLLSKGKTRELYVWGSVNSLFVNGLIDELILENGNLIIHDTKTRKSDRPPSEAQKRTAKFQLMLYKHLFDSLRSERFTHRHLMKCFDLSENSSVTNGFQEGMSEMGLKIEPDIRRFSQEVFSLFRDFPKVSDNLQIRYENQSTRKLICTDEFQFDMQLFEKNCNFVEGFWLGEREAIPVGEKDVWKCNFCAYSKMCAENQHLG